MAEDAIVDLVMKKLIKKGHGAIMSAINLESEVKKLQNTRTLIEATLLDVDSMSEHYSPAQLDSFQKLSCELDRLHDFSDVRATRELQKQVMDGNKYINEARLFFTASNQLVARFKDARKVKDIRKKLNSITIDHAQIGSINCMPTASQTRVLNGSSQDFVSNMVIGRDGDRDYIVNMLSEDSIAAIPSVTSIVGIGGLGKTTLAWYVYKDERVKSCFDVQFWVPANQHFDFRKVLEKIITCGTGELPTNICDMDQLYHHFRTAIRGKKFLLVLDNIWDNDSLRQKWANLKSLLKCGAEGSKVLLTTRNHKVAEIIDSANLYHLRELTEDDSWLLFQKIAFTQWQDPGVKEIGKEIANMCPNLPLVIQSIGSLLAGKGTVQEWQAFRNDQLASFACYGRDVMHTLKLSYDQLDARLKLCVTYCTLFPKGDSFHLDEMIHRWIALEYVEPKYGSQSLEEAGEEYMISLINVGFFSFSMRDDTDYAQGTIMHDVMFELVLSLAGFKYKVADSNTDKIDERVRHLSICKVAEDSYWEVPSSLFKVKHLQSFIRGNSTFGGKIKVRNLSMCDKLISRFKSLRVLDLNGMGIKELPTSLGDLTCLRFLNLSETDIVKLPKTITKLVHLQSLYLRCCYHLVELPKDMSKLVNLRHLLLNNSFQLSHMPTGLEKLTNLRTLDVFIVSKEMANVGKLADLNRLNDLSGELSINLYKESKDIVSSEINLKLKEKLRTLSISFYSATKEDERVLEALQPPSNVTVLTIYGYGGERLPGWMMDGQLESHLSNLVKINITGCKGCRYLCSLGRLPHLKSLYFWGLDNVEYIEESTSSGNANSNANVGNESPLFPSLETLSVYQMPKLKGWWRMWSSDEQDSREVLEVQQHQLIDWKPAFPKLKSLTVDNLELAIVIARQHLGGLTSVEFLYIYNIFGNPPQQRQALTFLNSCFPNIRTLNYSIDRELVVLPDNIRDLPFLETIGIYDCDKLKAIPEWIESLTSLTTLSLSYCPRLESLPRQISNLPNLMTLSIQECPILEERCKSPNGDYWPFIQHIPYLYTSERL
ncbi:putative disease resistance protein RGA1 [Spinacia oleracea]|uniref:Disease resistance protein RGA1 n=1 Tax=Spinacia oleracea TaxID=3562 RepID=A0A9R0I5W2_SPIOL|nr:putative disease resistance protein RGA1 [Spinacia oleracea]